MVLYEKGKIGSGIKCAEGFIDTLGILEKPEAGVRFKVAKANCWADKERYIHFPDDCGIWIIDRSTWQRSLAKRAHGLGVSIKENYPIDKSRLPEMLDTYGFIIDASGAPSMTSRMYGMAERKDSIPSRTLFSGLP